MTITEENVPSPAPAPTPDRSIEREGPAIPLGGIVWGVALVLIGIAWMLDGLGLFEFRPSLIVPGLLLVVGVALMVGSFWDAHPGLIVLGVFLTVFTLLLAATPFGAIRGGLGQRTYDVRSVAALEPEYQLGLGELRLDLRELALERDVSTAIEVGAGAVIVTLPADVSWEIEATVGAGEINLFGQRFDGIDVDRSLVGGDPADPTVSLDIEVGAGNIEVRR